MTRAFALVLIAAALSACTPPETYPVTGAECHEGDPVQDMETVDCIPSM